jgi:hypothetical protein
VLCYAPADLSGWVFVDCFAEHRDEYVQGPDATSGGETTIPWCARSAVPLGTSNLASL